MTALNRRQLLKSALAGTGSGIMSTMAHADTESTTVFLVLDDLSPFVSVEALGGFVGPFVRNGLPLSILIDLPRWQDAGMEVTEDLRRFLARLLNEYSGVSELIVHLPEISTKRAFFQARMLHEARKDLAGFFAEFDPEGRVVERIVSVADTISAPIGWDNGFRSGGMRNFIALSVPDGAGSEREQDATLLQLTGDVRLDLSDDADSVQLKIEEGLDVGESRTCLIGLGGLETMEKPAAETVGNHFSDGLLFHVDSGRITPSIPSEHHLRQRQGYQRLLTVALENGAADGGVSEATNDLMLFLADRGIPTAMLTADAEIPLQPRVDSVLCEIDAAVQEGEGEVDPAECAAATLVQVYEQTADWGRSRLGDETGEGSTGIDRNADLVVGRTIRVNTASDLQLLPQSISALRDTLILLSADLASDPDIRLQILRKLRAIQISASGRFVPIDKFLDTLTPFDPVFQLFQRERNLRPAIVAQEAEEVVSIDRDGLIEDAKTAWTYIETFRDERSGLLPTTVSGVGAARSLYNKMTMWDLGSLMFGLRTAAQIGLLSQSDFIDWSKMIIANLPVVEMAGLKLPCSEISTTSARPLTREFNACDVGRLLSALTNFREIDELTDVIDAKIAEWDIAETVQDGVYHSVINNRLRPFFISHCTHYSARALARFGIETSSPYDVDQETQSEAEWRMQLLYQAGRIGLLGAEPLLFEPLELGWTPEIRYLTDVLFNEQQYTYARTGKPVCVSEGPLDREPWFSYQGLNFGVESQRWGIEVIAGDRKFDQEGFLRDVTSLSVKSAFLWYAAHPHGYSRLLRNYARERAQTEGMGFASGIYTETGIPTANYTDINTNGIILEAIGYALANEAKKP